MLSSFYKKCNPGTRLFRQGAPPALRLRLCLRETPARQSRFLLKGKEKDKSAFRPGREAFLLRRSLLGKTAWRWGEGWSRLASRLSML